MVSKTHLCSAARSLCLLFLNQLLTCVVVRPVLSANSRFSRGDGYGLVAYQSLRTLLDFSLKQYDVSSPSQIVRGSGNLRRTRYFPAKSKTNPSISGDID